MVKKIWYSFQQESTDDWSEGTFNEAEAMAALRAGLCNIVAVIDDEAKYCIDEIRRDDLED